MRSHILTRLDLDPAQLAPDLDYLSNVPRIEEQYDEFSSGYWKNVSLANASGKADDTTYRDISGAAIDTGHGEHTPYLMSLVEEHFVRDRVKMVRARNLIDALVVPHRDFIDLGESAERYFRVFMTLEDNPQAFHADTDEVVRMRPGEVWFLDAAAVHSAANLSVNGRQSICLDFVLSANEDEQAIFNNPNIYMPGLEPEKPRRQPFTPEHHERLLSLAKVIDRDNFKDILFLLSKVHYRYQFPAEQTYDVLREICSRSSDEALATKAEKLTGFMIGARTMDERFTMTEWAA